MLDILLVCSVIFLVLVVNEALWHKKFFSGEVSRKIVHIVVGVIMAFSSLVLSYSQIQFLCLAFVLVILATTKLKLFNSIRAIKRDTSGELFFAIGIAACALIQPDVWIYVVAVLHLALADSIAALAGVKWGKKNRYSFFGNDKSIVGSIFFYLTSMGILFSVLIWSSHLDSMPVFVLFLIVPGILTLLENASWHGIDNLTVPVNAIVLLSYLSS